MSSVRKRSLPSGAKVWLVDYRDQSGTRRAKQFATKAEATSYETTVRGEIRAGTHIADAASLTLSEAGDLWLTRAEVEQLEESTIRQYSQHLKHHIKPLIGATKLSRLTRPAVEDFRDTLLESRSRPLTRAVLTSLKGILNEAQRRGLVGHNAAAGAEVRAAGRNKTQAEIPTKAQIKAIIENVQDAWRPIILTAIFTGLRASELRGLTWEHVDFEQNVILVRQRADFQNRMGPPKTKAGRRDVPMAPILSSTLKAWKLASKPNTLGLVFPTRRGTIHTCSNIHKRCWGPLQHKLGLVKIVEVKGKTIETTLFTFHSLRHAAASLFIEQGWSPKKVQSVMGHSSIAVTFDVYGHLWKDTESDRQAMAQIEARLLA
jgi:integrase